MVQASWPTYPRAAWPLTLPGHPGGRRHTVTCLALAGLVMKHSSQGGALFRLNAAPLRGRPTILPKARGPWAQLPKPPPRCLDCLDCLDVPRFQACAARAARPEPCASARPRPWPKTPSTRLVAYSRMLSATGSLLTEPKPLPARPLQVAYTRLRPTPSSFYLVTHLLFTTTTSLSRTLNITCITRTQLHGTHQSPRH